MPLRTSLILLLAAAMLIGCGRRGALQEPGEADAALAPTVSDSSLEPGNEGSLLDAESPGSQEPAEDRPATAPERPFFLDPLI